MYVFGPDVSKGIGEEEEEKKRCCEVLRHNKECGHLSLACARVFNRRPIWAKDDRRLRYSFCQKEGCLLPVDGIESFKSCVQQQQFVCGFVALPPLYLSLSYFCVFHYWKS